MLVRFGIPRLLAVFALCLTAGCNRHKPPYKPAEALKLFQLPAGFRIELVAAEPDVVDPVAISFDESGRLFVVEMRDYPLDPAPKGRIKLLEDRDGDGRYEHSTVFAEGLHMPTGVMRWRKGVLVTCAPDILYLEDTNGDGRADVRRVVLTGFATTNPQLRLNGLLYGIDNWIYAAYPRLLTARRYAKEFGDRGRPIRFPDYPEVPAVDTRSHDLRFRLDEPRLEAISGNSQFGHTFNEWGERFTVWNNDHVRHVVVDARTANRNPFLPVANAMQSASDHENAAAVYPIAENPNYIHDSQIGHFTSACGLSVYTGANLPPDLQNSSFTSEPVHNLVHRDLLEPAGATYKARRAYEGREFLASRDAWFRPVFTATGPDGALYIVDYYHRTVEHPEFVPPELLKDIDFQPRRQLGRIYRVVHESSRPMPKPALDRAPLQELVTYLSNPNMWWRTNAQRLLVDRRDRAAVPLLEALARDGRTPQARMHALWTLDGLHALSPDLVLRAFRDSEAMVRMHGARLAERRLNHPKIKRKLLELADDPEPKVRFQVAETLGSLPEQEAFPALKKIALRDGSDPWVQIAVLSSARDTTSLWYRALAKNAAFLRRIASVIGAKNDDREIAGALSAASSATLDGLAEGLRQARRSSAHPVSQPLLLKILAREHGQVLDAALRVALAIGVADCAELQSLVRRSASVAQDPTAPLEARADAIGLLGLDTSAKNVPLLAGFLAPQQPSALQLAASRALAAIRNEAAASAFLDHWRELTKATRELALPVLFRSPARVRMLLDAIERGQVQPWSLGPQRARQLDQNSDAQIRERAKKLLGDSDGDRKKVYERYLPAVHMKGDPQRGRQIFAEVCADCHKVRNVGHEVGPDLLSVTARYKESLLANILMPNEAIEPGYEEYMVETSDGRSIEGILARDTPSSVTLRRAKGEEDTVPRTMIASMRSLGVSPMPEGLEKNISVAGMADLIAYIKSLR